MSFLSLLAASCILCATTMAHEQTTLSTETNICSAVYERPKEYAFLEPVGFSGNDLRNYFKETYDHPLYPTILPKYFGHMCDLLDYSKGLSEPLDYIDSVFHLFNQKLKDCSWVNPFAFASLLRNLPDLVGTYYQKHEDRTLRAFKETLHSALLYRFNELKTDPQFFINSLADELLEASQEAHDMYALQTTTTRFLEHGLNKLIFNPHDDILNWNIFKELCKQLEILHDFAIIPDLKTLNELAWSLVCSFCTSLNYIGKDLPLSFYVTTKQELESQTLLLLELPEQEEAIATKKNRLQKALFDGEIQARAHEQGITILN